MAAHGLTLTELPLTPALLRPGTLGRILRARGVQGMVLFPDPLDGPLRLPELPWEQFAVVKIGLGYAERPTFHTVSSDYAYGTRLAIEQLERCGYRRIGLCATPALDWANGFLVCGQYLSYQHSLPARRRVPLVRSDHVLPTREEIVQWMRRHRPDCVLAYTPNTLKVLRETGFSVPAGHGYAQLSLHGSSASIAGVDQNTTGAGEWAVNLLLKQLVQNERGLPPHPTVTLVCGHWVEGATVRSLKDPPSTAS